MGFCLFNNVAIAAELAIRELGLERVLILDWDVHHGNGTAEASSAGARRAVRQHPPGGIYPGTGALSDVGTGEGEGYTINLPVPPGCDGELWLSLLEHIVVPAARPSGPISCWSPPASTPTAPTRWPGAFWRPARSPRWPATCATCPPARRAARNGARGRL